MSVGPPAGSTGDLVQLDILPLGLVSGDRGWRWGICVSSAYHEEKGHKTLVPALMHLPVLTPELDIDAVREALGQYRDQVNIAYDLHGLLVQVPIELSPRHDAPEPWIAPGHVSSGALPSVGTCTHIGHLIMQKKVSEFRKARTESSRREWLLKQLDLAPWVLQYTPFVEALQAQPELAGDHADPPAVVVAALRWHNAHRRRGRPNELPAMLIENYLIRALPKRLGPNEVPDGHIGVARMVAEMEASLGHDGRGSGADKGRDSTAVDTRDRRALELERWFIKNLVGPAMFPFPDSGIPHSAPDPEGFLLHWIKSPEVGRRLLLFAFGKPDRFQPLDVPWAPPWPPP